MLASAIAYLPAGIFLSPMAAAQQAQVQEGSSDAVTLDTVTVTGVKRDASDATLPMSTVVLTTDQVPAPSLDPTTEIARQAPGTNFVNFGRFGESYLTIRGIATLGSALNTLDSTVGYSVDGIPTSLMGLNAPLIDVEQIEVLRGPQGTTFGRNALGGAINIVSTPTDGTRELRFDAGIGTNGYGYVQGTAGGWLVPGTLAARGAVRVENYNGDIPNVIIGGEEGAARIGAARAAVRYTPDDTLAIDVSGQYTHNFNSNPSNILLQAPGFPVSGQDRHPSNVQDIASGTVKITKDFEAARFTSLTSYQDLRTSSLNDYTDSLLFGAAFGLPPRFFANPLTDNISIDQKERIFTQELRLNSRDDAPVQWVVGVNYFRSAYDLDQVMQTTYWPTLNGTIDNDILSQTVAIFADATVPLGERWSLSGGLRLAHDNQQLDGLYLSNGYPGTVPAFAQTGSYSDTYPTGRVALSYMWTADVMTYGSIARGYSSGGFERTTQYAPYGIATVPFEPATTWTYELGAKAKITDGLRVNASLFYNDVSDGQLSSFNTSTLQVVFANQDYRSWGVEAGATAVLAPGLDLSGSLSAIHSELVNVTPETMAAGAVEGNAVPQVPAFAANVTLAYRFSVERWGLPGEIAAMVNYQYVGTRYSDIANAGELDPYSLVNVRLGWEKDGFNLTAFANDVFDVRPVSYAIPLSPIVSAAYVGRGRVVGLNMSYRW